jgi:hypothetical protein
MERKFYIVPPSSDNWRQFREIKLSSLKTNPEMFSASLELQLLLGEEDWKTRSKNIWLAFEGNEQ